MHSFELEQAGDDCPTSATPDFDARTVELCGFPDGPPPEPDGFSQSCTSDEVSLSVSCAGEAIAASLSVFHTGDGLAGYDKVDTLNLTVTPDGTPRAAHTTLSTTVDIVPGAPSYSFATPFACDMFERKQITYVLEATDGETGSCFRWGRNPEGIADGTAFDEELKEALGTQLADCKVYDF